MQYGKLEEFVTLVTELVPELLSKRQRTQLILGLTARPSIDHHVTRIRPWIFRPCSDDEREAAESNSVELVQTLLEDQSEKEHFIQEVFPVHYGPRYDTALQILMWEFLSRLEELLPVPDFTQTTEWLGAASSILEECGQRVLDVEQLKTLLQHHRRHTFHFTADTILSTLSFPPKIRVVIGSEQDNSGHMRACPNADECIQNETEREGNREEREGQLNGGREEEEEEEEIGESQSDPDWEDEDNNDRRLSNLEQREEEGLSLAESSTSVIPGPSDGMNGDVPSRLLACSMCPFSHSKMAELHQHIRTKHQGTDSKCLVSEEAETDNPLPQRKTKRGFNKWTPICTLCGKVFKFAYQLQQHFRTHKLPFHCEKRYAKQSSLEIHQRIHTGEKTLVAHTVIGDLEVLLHSNCMCVHTLGSVLTAALFVGRGWSQDQILMKHLRMHKGERNYLCSICGKAFLASGELRLQTRLHTGECPYICEICGKGFKASCNLTLHMRCHTGKRPYSCTQ
ncbi:unnamed protein product, partial [Coregonus sp. 'balchen']